MSRSGTEATDAQSASRRLLETRNKDENVVLEFRPCHRQLMYVACLWSRWTKPGESDLLSFAAITDDLSDHATLTIRQRGLMMLDVRHCACAFVGLQLYRGKR
ncbi:hypothetical protein DPV79_26905 [Burkholderia reimsis]|uniref:Uncharacterized protein n=1 Tax=Burkholderia reimsis TaxID=2234132 RepID=A0A365QPF2_9BURK|nr:hypothetical protein DPV79_26905 [Burkholderia reimsis]